MSQKDLSFIALRVLAVYILIQAFVDLSQAINFFILPIFYERLQDVVQTRTINVLLYLGPFFVQLIVGIIVWYKAEKLSQFFILKNVDASLNTKLSLSAYQFQVAAISIIGLVFIVHTLPSFFTLGQSWVNMREIGLDYADTKMKGEIMFGLIEKLVRLILGFGLLFGSKGLVGLLERIRKI